MANPHHTSKAETAPAGDTPAQATGGGEVYDAAAEERAFPHWRRNMHVLFTGNMVNNMGFTLYFPFLPLILQELGVQQNVETWVGYYTGVLYVVTMFTQPVWGGVADHFGKKPVVLRASLGQMLGFSLMALAPSLWTLLALVAWIGICNGYIASSQALVAANTPAHTMGRALSNVQSGALIGATLGPAVGGLLAVRLPAYQQLYWVGGLCGLVASALAITFVREVTAARTAPFRLRLVRDLRYLLAVPNLGLLFFLLYLSSSTFFGSVTIVSVFTLQLVAADAPTWGLSTETWLAVVTLSLTLSSAAALPWWGRLLDRFEPRRLLAAAMGAALVCVLLYPLVQTPAQLTAVRLLLGLGAVGMQPAILRLIKALAPAGMDARALAFGTSAYMFGHGAAPFLAGQVGPLLGLRAYFLIHAGQIALGLALWWWYGMRRRGVAGA